jgi:hypothetical protein
VRRRNDDTFEKKGTGHLKKKSVLSLPVTNHNTLTSAIFPTPGLNLLRFVILQRLLCYFALRFEHFYFWIKNEVH